MSSENAVMLTPEQADAEYRFGGIAFGGFLDDFISTMKPDLTKLDNPKAILAIENGLDSLKPCQTWLAHLDDTLLDKLKAIMVARVNAFSTDSGPVMVGADDSFTAIPDVNYTATDVDEYLRQFGAVNPEIVSRLRRRPRTLNALKTFSTAAQAKIVGNPMLVMLLTTFGPYIIKWIIEFLSK